MTYLVTYDLDRPGQDYTTLINALQNEGAVKILLSTWVLQTTATAAQVRDHFWQFMDGNDRLFVTTVNTWAGQNIMNRDAALRVLPK